MSASLVALFLLVVVLIIDFEHYPAELYIACFNDFFTQMYESNTLMDLLASIPSQE